MRNLKFVLSIVFVAAFVGLITNKALAWCDNPGILHCGSHIDSTNSDGHTDVTRYGCTGNTNFNGKAHVYQINHPGGLLWVTLGWTGTSSHAMWVFILSSCDANHCVVADSHYVAQNLPAGIYWIVVDGRSSTANTYHLHVYCGDHPLPVEVSTFDATAEAGSIVVRWTTASKQDVSYYEVTRSSDSQTWQTVGHVDSRGNTTGGFAYSYRDEHVVDGVNYQYQLIAHNLDGSTFAHPQIASGSLGIEVQPSQFALDQNYPNPFNPSTSIKFDVAEAGHVKLAVYDLSGRIVANLVDRELAANSYSVTFDGANLPSGMYFYRLEAGNFTSTKKLVLMK